MKIPHLALLILDSIHLALPDAPLGLLLLTFLPYRGYAKEHKKKTLLMLMNVESCEFLLDERPEVYTTGYTKSMMRMTRMMNAAHRLLGILRNVRAVQ
jgi:hypothetical protein